MTIARLDSIGLCAHYCTQGDWAFNFALGLAERCALQLNVFYFLADPFDPDDRTGQDLPPHDRWPLIVEREKALRFYYEVKLGDFLDVGFRVCEDREWSELHRCLTKREFQVLVLPYPEAGATFGGRTIDEFANAFVCPVVLVGPQSPEELHVNRPAALMADRLGLTTDAGLDRDVPGLASVPTLTASPRVA